MLPQLALLPIKTELHLQVEFTTVYLGEYLITKDVAEMASELWGHDEPTVMRAEPTVRANRLFVLVTLKNETENN